jgi:CRP-like cAMP-binding protein
MTELSKTLSYNYVFRGVPSAVVSGIAALAEVRRFEGGDTVLRQFDKGRDLLIILDGAAVTRTFSGEVVAEFGPGSVLGEMALIDGEARCANVSAKGPLRAAVISADTILSMMDARPDVAGTIYSNIAKVLCRRLRSMNALAGASRERVSL